ncbi:MAG: hypothetical protein ABEI86_01085 [Halobacteriaceae archaeon]
MAAPSAQPLLLALGYGAVGARFARRWYLATYEPDTGYTSSFRNDDTNTTDPDPPSDELFKVSFGGFGFAGLIPVTAFYMIKNTASLSQWPGPLLALLFQSVPSFVGIILLVVAVLDHILEKEGFVG